MRCKQIKYVFFALLCMCVTPLITHAECDYQRRAELSRLASNVQLAYTYNDSRFTVYMTNLTSDLYAVDSYGRVYQGDGSDKTFEYYSGTINFDIYASDRSCVEDKILRKTINLPTVNTFAFYPECQQYPNFKYCQNWGELTITDEQFQSALNEYKNQLNATLSAGNGELNVLDTILDTLENNKVMFIFLGSVVGVTLIVWIIKKKLRK